MKVNSRGRERRKCPLVSLADVLIRGTKINAGCLERPVANLALHDGKRQLEMTHLVHDVAVAKGVDRQLVERPALRSCARVTPRF